MQCNQKLLGNNKQVFFWNNKQVILKKRNLYTQTLHIQFQNISNIKNHFCKTFQSPNAWNREVALNSTSSFMNTEYILDFVCIRSIQSINDRHKFKRMRYENENKTQWENILENSLVQIHINLVSVKTYILACTLHMKVFWLVSRNKFICWIQSN